MKKDYKKGRPPLPDHLRKVNTGGRITKWIRDELIRRGLMIGPTIDECVKSQLKLKEPKGEGK